MVDISCINPKSSYWAVYSTHLVETDDYPIADILFIEFVIDGGPAAKALKPKFDISMKHVSSHFGFSAPHVEMRHIVAASIFLKGLEGLLFISSCSFGTCLLVSFFLTAAESSREFLDQPSAPALLHRLLVSSTTHKRGCTAKAVKAAAAAAVVPRSQVMDKVNDFLAVIAKANSTLELEVREIA
ncbi:uncharacterized protein LOC121975119 isoform X7 [Zingiber officinale]|uniref:uncharacterized protein LOC121975119 isoform X7 n=1 Tax=Zingiber officinale TaxID=94328 RepID=UPI001C4C17DB|nr:uncharacterized protein LOC121975119 isoform X7 [Zingiber officinale]